MIVFNMNIYNMEADILSSDLKKSLKGSSGQDKSHKKIVLFNPNPRGYKGEEENYIIPPFSLLAAASLLDKEGYKVKIIDQTVDKDYKEQIINEVKDALCFGITSMTGHQILNGIEASKLAKKYNPSLPVVWGGYHPSILPEQTVEEDYIDFVVRGQGEITFLELVEYIEKGLPLNDVKGITYKKRGRVFSNAERQIEDINNFPPTPFHLLDTGRYVHKSLTKRTIGYRTSQGCTYNCAFCAELCVTKRRWYGLSPQRVMDELLFLTERYGVDGLLIYDSNFFLNPERVRTIIRAILKKKLNLKIGFLNGRVDQLLKLDDEYFELLRKVGCYDLLIGAESGSQRILDFINKGIRVDDILKLKRRLKEHSIIPSFSFMFGFPRGGGFKITLREEFDSLMKIIKSINSIDDNNHIRIWIYTPYPGTPLFNLAKKMMKMPSSLEGWGRFNLTHSNVPWIPKRYEKIINHLNLFIFPYTSEKFSINWKDKNKPKLKRAIHYLLHVSASLRMRYGFFGFPLELIILRYIVKHKNSDKTPL